MKNFRFRYAAAMCAVLLAGASLVHADVTTAPASQNTTQPAENFIHRRMQTAKESYDAEVDGAKKRLLAFFATKVDSAQKQGDLVGLKNLSAMKAAFEKDGALPQESTDLAVRDNVNAYLFSQRVAAKNLSVTYTGAIRDYTKAGKVAEAEALQAEADEFTKVSGGSVAVAPSVPGVPASATPALAAVSNGQWFTFNKTSGLPRLFEANPDVVLGDEGLSFPSLTYMRSSRTDFVRIDFSLDVVLQVKDKDQVRMGIGPAMPGKMNMIGIVMSGNGNALSEAVGQLGKVGPGTHLFHIDKHGTEFTTSIVLNYKGKYLPDYKITGNMKGFRWLTTENSRLFIAISGGGVVVKAIRLTQ